MTSSTFPNDRSWRWPSPNASLLLRQALRSRFRFLRLGLRTRSESRCCTKRAEPTSWIMLRRLFGLDSLVEAAKSLAKVAVMAFALWHVLQADLPALMQAPRWDPQVLLARTMPPVLHMLYVVLAVQAVIAGFDLLWSRLRHAQ